MLQPRDLRRRVAAVCAVGLGVGLVPMVAAAPAANAAATELFFSEYIEGSSNNKALEIFNGTGAPIDLGSDGYNVQMFFNGNTNAGLTINLTGSVADGDVFVVAHSSAFAEVLDQADQTNGSGWFNGDDAVVLRKGTNVIDSIGQVGVMTYTWAGNSASGNAYRLRPIGALDGVAEFEAANERPESVPEVGGRIQVAGMNVLNYFNTWDGRPDEVNNCTFGVGGPPADCRGADDEFEFERQATKTVEAIVGMGAEVVGVVEIENDGYGPDSALADLVDRLNAATEPGTWGYVDVDERTGQVNALGTDAIKVGVIYQRDAVVPMGDTAVLNTEEFVTGGDSEERNRPALAQAFVEKGTGGSFVAVVNHLKSKGSACDTPAANDGQGNCNDVRVTAAGLLADWLASDPTGTSEQDTLIIGDLNSYAMEDPITLLKGAGYTDLIREYADGEENPYSYVFDGQWGYLDHAMGTASLAAQVTGVAEWHVNADEPSVLDYNTDFKSAGQVESLYAPDEFRNSDHDPVIVGLDLTPRVPQLRP